MREIQGNIEAKQVNFDGSVAIQFSWNNQVAVYRVLEEGFCLLKGSATILNSMSENLKEMFSDFIAAVKKALEPEMTEKEVRTAAKERELEIEEELVALDIRIFVGYFGIQTEGTLNEQALLLVEEYKKIYNLLDRIFRLKRHFDNPALQQARNSGERAQNVEIYEILHQQLKEMVV
jgi:hypothetical protein